MSRAAAPAEAAADPRPGPVPGGRGRPHLVPMAILVVELVALAVAHAGAFVDLSPVDELMHFDNVVRSSRSEPLPDARQPLDQETLREVECRAANQDAWRVAPSDDPCLHRRYDPEDRAWRGLNPTMTHTPIYYRVTGMLARLLRAAVPGFGLLTWSRLLGLTWVLPGCYLTLVAGRALGLDRWAVTGATAMALAVPSQLGALTMVNPDASLFLAGAGLVLVAVQVERERWPWTALPAATFAALLLDATAMVAVLLVAATFGLLALVSVRNDRRRARRHAVIAVSAIGGAVAVVVGWTVFVTLFLPRPDFTGSPQDVSYSRSELTVGQVLGPDTLLAMLPPVDQPNAPAALRSSAAVLFGALAALLLAAASVTAVLGSPVAVPLPRLAASTLLALVVTPPAMVLLNYASSRWYFGIPGRYGLSALPALALVLAWSARTRVGTAVVGATAAGLVVSLLAAMA